MRKQLFVSLSLHVGLTGRDPSFKPLAMVVAGQAFSLS